MAQKNIKMDSDTEGMLEDLVDQDRAKRGKSSNSDVVTALIRDKHRIECPDQWNGSFFKHYRKQTA